MAEVWRYNEEADLMRKRDSLRRWKARCRIGKAVPRLAIVNYGLCQWFVFSMRDTVTEYYYATTKSGL